MHETADKAHWSKLFASKAPGIPGLVGRSLPMLRISEQLRQIAPRMRLALIEGEAGTGKQLLARHVHALRSPEGRFAAEEATALFHPEAGLSAPDPLRSAIHRAAQGLLLIHNIDQLTSSAQTRLLNFLRTFESTVTASSTPGATLPSQVVCTTRQPLHTQVLSGVFLPEIYYRLSAVKFSLPPLRERKEDIPALAQMFIDSVALEHQRALRGLGPGTLAILLRHRWPGNVRELESVIRAACLSAEGQWLRPIDLVILPLEANGSTNFESSLAQDLNLDGVVRRHIHRVLKACDGNKARTASRLGISRSTLYRMLESDLSIPMAPMDPMDPMDGSRPPRESMVASAH